MDRTDYIQLYRIAESYYLKNLSQEQIAKRESISRPHVSRMLAKAKELGMVDIRIRMPNSAEVQTMAKELQQRLELKDIRIAYIPHHEYQERDVSMQIAAMAVSEIQTLLPKGNNIGIGWGYTVYQASVMMQPQPPRRELNFIPLVGLAGEDTPYLQSNVIANRFAEKYDATSYYALMPVIRDNSSAMGHIEEKSYQRLLEHWEKLDGAIIGLGPTPQKESWLLREASIEYNNFLDTSGTVGDILANFFYRDGKVLDTSQYYLQVSLPLHALQKLETVVCLAGGINKAEGLIAAAKNHFYNVLVTDSLTAEEMLRRLNHE